MNMFTKVIKVFYNTLMTIIIILGLTLVIAFAIGIKPFVVESGSMEPNIHVGSVCFVNTRAKYEDVKQNDVIAFNSNGGIRVTHRVISISEEGFETKGDANENKDGPIVKRKDLIGKTMFSIPKVGYAIKEIQKPIGMIMAGVAIIIFVLLGFLFEDSKEENKTKNKKGKHTENAKQKETSNATNLDSNAEIQKNIQEMIDKTK